MPAEFTPSNRDEALALLVNLGAPPRLVRHAELVDEAAELLIRGIHRLKIPLSADFVRVGAILHDVGKALHPNELSAPGEQHERAGEALLLQHGASPSVARIARSHAKYRDLAETTEELVIALADKLWKGARVTELEELVVLRFAETTGRDRWDLFSDLDTLFEEVAGSAEDRLGRSLV